MAELDSDPRNTIDDEDLEDGEIETDEENEEVKPAKPVATEPTKKTKIDDDSKKTNDIKNKNENRKSIPDSGSIKSKKLLANDATKDDWMGDVENALAKALQKDGIAPKPVKLNSKKTNDEPKDPKEQQKETKGESSSSKSNKHKRKHNKNDKDSQRKKARLIDDDPERTYHSNESEDFDEYEMMNVRGGSPLPHGGSQSQGSQKQNVTYYDSDASYSSYESDIGEHRGEHRRRNRAKRRANDRRDRRNHRGGHSKRDHKRRRGDDSDDENIGHTNNSGGGGGNNRGNNNNNQPRKAELCKFYLMECCAKGEKCLYMHGDFPCKFYYLGMKNHNRENCKFSHGKPLTDQLRAVLLKHLETAPKEILGDFPRIARENAINMINAQHQKLLVKFGMEPEPNTTNTSNTSQTSKLPSLLDINLDKYQPPSNSELGLGNMKKDKPRKSRWCDQRSNDSHTNHSSQNSNNSASNQSVNENDIKLSSFTNILTAEQLDKLAKMGIDTVSQISQLTILQVMELGLEIKVISELQLKASQLQQMKQTQQQQQKSSQNNKTPTEPQNPFSNETLSQDQDMRIPLNTTKTSDQLELANQDIDMRILAIPPRSDVDRPKSDSFSKNTQSEKANEHASRKTIDYSQYLKDANIDLNQSDLEDPLVTESSKGKKKGYDSDEDEGNPLVIEEEDDPTHTEEPNSENDEYENQRANDDTSEPNSQASTYHDSQRDQKSEAISIPSPDPSANSPSQNENILPPYYASSSMYPTSITNKIDLSSSVSQLLKKEDTVQKTDIYIRKVDSGFQSEPIDGNNSPSQSSLSGTSFYSRQIPETNHPAPQALDEKPLPYVDYDSPSETNARNNCSSPVPEKPARKCIYEVSSEDEETNDDKIRSPCDDDDSQDSRSKNMFSLSKDKDMRIPPIFLEKDFSNGDIDLRLPFKPMVNYIPATEIDASITSHAPITYEVKEVDIPKPDYSELRKNFNTHENTLDPRLKRILRIKEDYSEPETNFPLSTKASPFSPPHEPELSTIPITKMDTVSGDPRRQRTDPRRPNAHINTANTNSSVSVLNKPSQRSVHLDIQNILQKSNWYNECSSKQKIMVNQQLAIVSTELKKFHADPSENKIFDLNFINQNQLLQGVLTNLGIFINEDGEFIQLDQTSLGGNNMSTSVAAAAAAAARNAAGQQQGLVDLMSIPMDIDYLRNKQQHDVQQQQQAAALQAINALGGQRFLSPGASQMLGFGPLPDVIRPGLLGIAPNMTLNEAYNLMQNPRDNAAYYRGSGSGNNGGSGGGSSGGGNNRRTGGGMRRNQNFDRNNSRRK